MKRVLLIVLVAAIAAAPAVAPPFAVTLMNFIGLSAIVALGLVLMTGFGGLTSFGQAAFVGVGAYAAAWTTTSAGMSPWLGLLLALTATALLAAFLGAITLRLGGHFLPLSTIAWGLAIYFLFAEIPGLGQHDGIKDIPPITLFGLSFASNDRIYYIIWLLLGLAMALVANLLDSRKGRAIRSLRGGAVLLASLGINQMRIRLYIFIIAAMLAGISGWLYAHMTRFVSPSPFEIRPSIEYLLMALVGGARSIYGAVVGAALVILAKNSIEDLLPYLTNNAGQLQTVVFSVFLVLILQHARGGLTSFVVRLLPPRRPKPVAAAEGLPRRDLPPRGQPLLSLAAVNKSFGGLAAVKSISFEMSTGEILGLIGPNGAGKSTTFNLLTGAMRCDSGEIRFLGEDITRLPQTQIARRGIGRTFQHIRLRPHMTALDNVQLGTHSRTRAGFLACALRLGRAEAARATREAMDQLARVGLADRMFEKAGNLSLGSQRVLEIARALAMDPVLLVLDEPAAGLRHQEKEALAELLRSLRAQGTSILLVEHDVDFVMKLVDRLVVMDFGAMLMQGLPEEVRHSPAVQEAYLGSVT
uniref:ABC transporter related n=1 Tax=Rhodopseudomonas palustris (strain BisA53) TaxID=316055 RepID=Q07LP1_RHOP5